MLTVRTILEEKGGRVYSVAPENTVYEALLLMAERDIGAVAVMKGGRLSGIFSERDYARKIALKGLLSKETRISEVMTPVVFSVGPEKNIFDCMELMTNKHIRHLPVMEGERVTGMISIGDVVNAIIRSQAGEIKSLRHYINGAT